MKPVIKALHFDRAIGKRYVDDSFLDMAKLDDFANIKELHNCLKSCQLCNLSKSRKNVVFDKKESAKILLVLKNPMLIDDEIGTPMNGNLGKELIKTLIDECKFDESDIYVTFVVKCFNKAEISRIDLLKCTPFLFDEIEKAHPDVFNLLLQVLDDGRLTDNKGHVVNFKNTIIIMTSNLGSYEINQKFAHITPENRERVEEEAREEVWAILKKSIRPEFLNRIDEVVMFKPLTAQEIASIVRLQLQSIGTLLKSSDIELTYSDAAVTRLTELGYSPEFGARALKRVLQREILNELSKALLGNSVDKDRPIHIDVDAETKKFTFTNI